VPVLFVEEKAAQLFRDIAIAISCAVFLSLFVSITVIPTLGARLIRRAAPAEVKDSSTIRAGRRGPFLWMRERIVAGVAFVTGSWWRSVATVMILTVASLSLAWTFLPQAEYLP